MLLFQLECCKCGGEVVLGIKSPPVYCPVCGSDCIEVRTEYENLAVKVEGEWVEVSPDTLEIN